MDDFVRTKINGPAYDEGRAVGERGGFQSENPYEGQGQRRWGVTRQRKEAWDRGYMDAVVAGLERRRAGKR